MTADDGCSTPATDSVLLTVLPPFDLAVTAGPTACHGSPTTLLLEALDPPGLTHVFEGNALGTGAQIVDAVAGTAVQWTLIDSIQGCTLDTALLVPGHPPLTAAFSVTPSGDCIAWDAQPLGFIDLSSGTESGQWSWTPSKSRDRAPKRTPSPGRVGSIPNSPCPLPGPGPLNSS